MRQSLLESLAHVPIKSRYKWDCKIKKNQMGYLSEEQLKLMEFCELGSNVLISDKASIYNAKNIKLGSNIRIDDFCILSAGEDGIEIGNFIHISCYASLIGKSKITLGNYVNISSRTSVYSSSDDYSGNFMTGPIVPLTHRNVDDRAVIIEDHAIIAAQCVVLPGVTIGEGTAIGAFSLVSKNVEPWGIYIGSPLRFLKKRSDNMLRFLGNV